MGNIIGSSDKQIKHKVSDKYHQSYGILCNESGFMSLKFRKKL
jgi:hypothetical protein